MGGKERRGASKLAHAARSVSRQASVDDYQGTPPASPLLDEPVFVDTDALPLPLPLSPAPSHSSFSSFTPLHANDPTNMLDQEFEAIMHEASLDDPLDMHPDVQRHYLELHDELGKENILGEGLLMDPTFDLDCDILFDVNDDHFLC